MRVMKIRFAALKVSRVVDLITFQSPRMLIANSKRVAEGPSSNPVHGCAYNCLLEKRSYFAKGTETDRSIF